jgi:hypothetical protein
MLKEILQSPENNKYDGLTPWEEEKCPHSFKNPER